MTKAPSPATKRPLIHHPSDVLDQYCVCDATSASWTEFDAALTAELQKFEDEHRSWFTPKAVRKSLGR